MLFHMLKCFAVILMHFTFSQQNIFLSSSTHERKSKTNIVMKANRYYLKHNTLSEVGHVGKIPHPQPLSSFCPTLYLEKRLPNVMF